mgnify:CR=1 FL=1
MSVASAGFGLFKKNDEFPQNWKSFQECREIICFSRSFRAEVVAAVDKISAFKPQGPQFEP